MTSVLIFLLPAASDDRRSHESLWECHTAGSDLGTDGVSGEDTPVLLNSLEPPMGVETNGMDRRGGEVASASEDRAASEPEEGRSPVEEAGREVEGAEDEELGSTVEEGEEAALALGVLSAESDLPWLPIKQASVGHSEEGYQPCEFRDGRFGDEREYADASISMAETLETEVSCTRDCTVTQLGLI